MPGKIEGILPHEIFRNVFCSYVKTFLLVLETSPTSLTRSSHSFLAEGWDVCLGVLLCVTDLESSHSVDVVGSYR